MNCQVWQFCRTCNRGRSTQCWHGAHLMPNPSNTRWCKERRGVRQGGGSGSPLEGMLVPAVQQDQPQVLCSLLQSLLKDSLGACRERGVKLHSGRERIWDLLFACVLGAVQPSPCWGEGRLWMHCTLCRSAAFVILCFNCALSWTFSTNVFMENLRLLCGSRGATISLPSGGCFNKLFFFVKANVQLLYYFSGLFLG